MKTLTLYEIGIDTLPVEGMGVLVFDSRNSFNMFDQHYAVEGEVIYMYGDIQKEDGEWCETLEEAYQSGGYIETSEHDIQDGRKAITIDVDSSPPVSLTDGVLWMYAHEYYPVLADIFPFQEWEEYQIAKREGWIKELEYVKDEREWHNPNGRDMRFDESRVEFNGNIYKLKWVCSEEDKSLMEWSRE